MLAIYFRGYFNPRTPCGVRRKSTTLRASCNIISIHAPHAGCDIAKFYHHAEHLRFQSTHPMRGATAGRVNAETAGYDFNPRTPCGVRREMSTNGVSSIADFNPRTPCGVRRLCYIRPARTCRFQSTHPMRGATSGRADRTEHRAISIHAPHAGCDDNVVGYINYTNISIHAPHAGCDSPAFAPVSAKYISIHAPHAGCDFYFCAPNDATDVISIHAPHAGCDGARQIYVKNSKRFQSTHPMRGATTCLRIGNQPESNFNPRTPCGVRQQNTTKSPCSTA